MLLTSKTTIVMVSIMAISTVFAACTRGGGTLSPPGMQLLRMAVRQDDRTVLSTTFDAPDSEGPAKLWAHAGTEPFSTDETLASIPAMANDPLRARLTGAIEITITHVDRVRTRASLTSLELVRSTSSGMSWYLPPEEVERVRKAAGL